MLHGVPARLIAFVALLGVVFALATVAGNAADLGRTETTDASEGHGGMEAEPAADAVRGLGVSEGGLTLDTTRTEFTPGRESRLRFAVRDRDGRVVRDFDVEHAKRMHVVIARRDLTGFRHLHPTQGPDGSWSVPVTLDDPGSYRLFADFSADGARRTLGADLAADGRVVSRPVPRASSRARVDGFDVALEQDGEDALAFDVTRDGRPVDVQPYLGARGHLVALREGDLAYLHVHPDRDRLRFESHYPSAARYRLFLQFKVDGRVHTAAFTREVER